MRCILVPIVLLAAMFAFCLLGAAPSRSADADKQALLALEEEWLHARDAATLDRILASDFVHIVPGGIFLNKREHIDWFVKHLPPADRDVRLDHLQIRLYGDTGIVNGYVISADKEGTEARRTAFTDVFVYRDGRWQAVNAQEDLVDASR